LVVQSTLPDVANSLFLTEGENIAGDGSPMLASAVLKHFNLPRISRMSIRSKLLITLVIFGAAAVAGTAWIGYFNAKRSLTEAAMNQLTGIRRSRAYHVESYFRTIRNHATTLSEDRMFIAAMEEFRDAFRKLDKPQPPEVISAVQNSYRNVFYPQLTRFVPGRGGPEQYFPTTQAAYHAQYHFVVQNPFPWKQRDRLEDSRDASDYARVHRLYHRPLRKVVRSFGYYDLMLVEPETRSVVYTVAKEPDFGTNLVGGPFRDTGLSKIVQRCSETNNPNDVFFADFVSYEPSLGAPALFVCSPIFNGPKRAGILVMQLSNVEFDRVVSGNRGWERDGLGQSGDCGIVGSDFLMRTTARTFAENPERHLAVMRARGVPEDKLARMKAFGTTILQQNVRLPSVELALQGKEGTLEQLGSAGRSSFVSYMPLRVEGLNWSLAARIDKAEALAGAEKLKRQSLLWSLPLLGIAGLLALAITRTIVRPVLALADGAERVRSGDLTVRLPITSEDELGILTGGFNSMVSTLQEKTDAVEQKNRENELLLLNILPGEIAERLKRGEDSIADSFAEVTVLFGDLVGFTVMSGKIGPDEVVNLLNGLFTRFDEIAQELGVEKIKTIGDAYMAVCGLPKPQTDHTARIVEMARRMLAATQEYGKSMGMEMELRIGINSGPVVAGVIGVSKFIYDLWGDTVNIASRMESHGIPGAIQVTRAVYEQLKDNCRFRQRGPVEIKGKGLVETWLLDEAPSVASSPAGAEDALAPAESKGAAASSATTR
jgi:class 3 adenylate cyclase